MSDDINDYEEQLNEVFAEIKKIMTNEMPKLKGRVKLDKLEYAKGRVNRGKQLLKSIYVELRDMDKAVRQPIEMRSKEKEQELNNLLQDINWNLTSTQNDENLAGTGIGRQKDIAGMTAKEMTTEAKAIQEQSKASTERTKAVLQHTIEIGTTAAKTLKDQGQQLQDVDKDIDTLESNLRKAAQQIRAYIRKLATDKVVLLMVLLVLLGILAVIITPMVSKPVSTAFNNVKSGFQPPESS